MKDTLYLKNDPWVPFPIKKQPLFPVFLVMHTYSIILDSPPRLYLEKRRQTGMVHQTPAHFIYLIILGPVFPLGFWAQANSSKFHNWNFGNRLFWLHILIHVIKFNDVVTITELEKTFFFFFLQFFQNLLLPFAVYGLRGKCWDTLQCIQRCHFPLACWIIFLPNNIV